MQIKSLNELTEETEVDADDLLLIQKAHVQGNPSRKIKSASVKNYLKTLERLEEIEPTADENARVTRHYKLIMSDGEALKDEENNFVILDIPEGAGIQNVNYTQSNEDDGNNKISFTLTDGSTTPQFDIKNGSRGNGIESITAERIEPTEENPRGKTVVSIATTDEETNATFNIPDGVGIKSIEAVGTPSNSDGAVNTYEITLNEKDGDNPTELKKFRFNVKNGTHGASFSIFASYPSIQAMNADAENIPNEKMVVINTGNVEDEDNAKLYIKTDGSLMYLTDLSGAQGIKGDKGDSVTASWSGTTLNVTDKNGTHSQNLKGDKGDQGDAPLIYRQIAISDYSTYPIGTSESFNFSSFCRFPKVNDFFFLFFVSSAKTTGVAYFKVTNIRESYLSASLQNVQVLSKFINLTKAQYEALPSTKNTDGTYYNIIEDDTTKMQKVYFDFPSGITYDVIFSEITQVLGNVSKVYFCDSENVSRIHVSADTNVTIKYFNAATSTDPATITATKDGTTTTSMRLRFFVKKFIN